MGIPGEPAPFDGQTRRSSVVRSSELIIVGDGGLGVPSGAASTTFDATAVFGLPMLTPQQSYSAPASAADNNSPLQSNEIQNYDSGNANFLGYLRWRHYGDKSGNFLFCDGHVESMQVSQVQKRNLRYDP